MSEPISPKPSDRLERINDIAKKIIQGEKKSALFQKHKDVLDDVRPQDIFALPMYQESSPQSDETILEEAGKFVNLFHASLEKYAWDEKKIPLIRHVFAENDAIREIMHALRKFYSPDVYRTNKDELLKTLNELEAIRQKFQRSQNVLFPAVESHVPSPRPLKILWMLQDTILDALHTTIRRVRDNDTLTEDITKTMGSFYYQLIGYFDKEELILLPSAAFYLPDDRWPSLMTSAMEFGFVGVDVDADWHEETVEPVFRDGLFVTETGSVDPERLQLIFDHLPIAITYVDAKDRVRYFNQPKERHFPRSKEVIGRKVQQCHPKKSVDVVEKILQAFRNHEKDEARFWMDFRGKKLLIVYYPIYDSDGTYQGVLETTQTVDDIMQLEGEKRLLDWDS